MFGGDHDTKPQRPRGKRHQPRDMDNGRGNPIADTHATATSANNDRYAVQRDRMQEGQSFLDQMYKSERPGHNSGKGLSGGGKRRASGQHDNLNVFEWNNGASSPGTRAGPTGRARTTQGDPSEGAKQLPTHANQANTGGDQRQRDVEAQKFEMHTDGGFLCFSEDTKDKPQKGKGTRVPAVPSAAYGSPQHGMMDALVRDDTAAKGGASKGRSMKRHMAQTKRHDGPDFAGFPGMGAHSNEKSLPHIRRREVESNVFLPAVVPGLGGTDGVPRHGVADSAAPSRRPARPAAPHTGEEAEDEEMNFDAVMAAIDPSQLTDEELQHYLAYLRERQGEPQKSQPEWIDAGQSVGDCPTPSVGSAGNCQRGDMASQAQRIMLYQRRQRGE